jgi:hypothetical protein
MMSISAEKILYSSSTTSTSTAASSSAAGAATSARPSTTPFEIPALAESARNALRRGDVALAATLGANLDYNAPHWDADLHEFVLECQASGLLPNAQTARLYQDWRRNGLTHNIIISYILPETALAPQPSLRYAAAIARRLIKSGILDIDNID